MEGCRFKRMPRTGRPPLTVAVLQERIDAYCRRYGVAGRNDDGFPVYPAGRRESPQHREWVVLFKAMSRLRAREAARELAKTEAAGLCPTCRRPFTGAAPADARR